jgi:hypothetical protein
LGLAKPGPGARLGSPLGSRKPVGTGLALPTFDETHMLYCRSFHVALRHSGELDYDVSNGLAHAEETVTGIERSGHFSFVPSGIEMHAASRWSAPWGRTTLTRHAMLGG